MNRRSEIYQQTIGCSPSLIIDAVHHLTIEQVLFLSRGPTYVPIGQMHVSPAIRFDDLWSKQSHNLRQQMNVFFSTYRIGIDRSVNFQKQLADLFKETFAIPLPTCVDERARYERELICSIRWQLQQDQLVLRRMANGTNLFYLCRADTWQSKIDQFWATSTSYELMSTIDTNNPLEPLVEEMVKSLDSVLEAMQERRVITEQQFKQLRSKNTIYQLPKLDFLPWFDDDGHLQVQPTVSSCYRCPIKAVAQFLDDLLQPLLQNGTRATTVSNGSEFIHRLVPYDASHLLPTTRFVTYQVQDFYQLFSHRHLLDALGDFLHHLLPVGRHQNLTIDALLELASFVLQNNVVIHGDRIYRYIKGSPLSLPLTRTLGNIYLHEWQKSLLNRLGHFEEFYARYHDTAFLTWNGREEKLHAALDELNGKHPDLRIKTTVGSSAVFLDAHVENSYGDVRSRVHHPLNETAFLFPYVIGHPRLSYRQWFQWAMRRAVRYSTERLDFDQERLQIELTFLANGYSLEFVEMSLANFYRKYFIVSPPVPIDVRTYRTLRERVMNGFVYENEYRLTQETWKQTGQLVQLNYFYDWGPRHVFNEQFKRLWLELIKNDPTFANIELKLKLSTIHCYPLNALFAS